MGLLVTQLLKILTITFRRLNKHETHCKNNRFAILHNIYKMEFDPGICILHAATNDLSLTEMPGEIIELIITIR